MIIHSKKYYKEASEWKKSEPSTFRQKFLISVHDNVFYRQIELLLNFLNGVHKTFKPIKIMIWPEDLSETNISASHEITGSINIDENQDSRLLSLLHEIGHFVDHTEFTDNLDEYQLDSSLTSSNNPDINSLSVEIRLSKMASRLRQELRRNIREGNEETVMRIEYWLKDTELFARAYQQYIIWKIEKYRDIIKKEDGGKYMPLVSILVYDFYLRFFALQKKIGVDTFWEKEDFVEIYNIFEKIFKQV